MRTAAIVLFCALVCVGWAAPTPSLPFGWLLSGTTLRSTEFVLPYLRPGFREDGNDNHTLQATFQWSRTSSPQPVKFGSGDEETAPDRLFVKTKDADKESFSADASVTLPAVPAELTKGTGIITFTLDGKKLASFTVNYDFSRSLRRKFVLKEFEFSHTSGGGFTPCSPSRFFMTVDWNSQRASTNFTYLSNTCDGHHSVPTQNQTLVMDQDAVTSLPWLSSTAEFSGNVTQLQSYEYPLVNYMCDGPSSTSTFKAKLVDLDGVHTSVSVVETYGSGCGSVVTTNKPVPGAAWHALRRQMQDAFDVVFPSH